MENNMKRFNVQGKTKLVSGSISMPELAGLRFIVVPASENGKPEGDTYDVLDKKWKNVKAEFKGWFAHHWDFKLGSLHQTFVQSDTCIVHMLCYTAKNVLDKKGLETAMKKLSAAALSDKASVHMVSDILEIPEFEPLIKTHLLDKGINVYFYQDPTKVETKVDEVGAVVVATPKDAEPEKEDVIFQAPVVGTMIPVDTVVNAVVISASGTVEMSKSDVVQPKSVKKVSKKIVEKVSKPRKTMKKARPVQVSETKSDTAAPSTSKE